MFFSFWYPDVNKFASLGDHHRQLCKVLDLLPPAHRPARVLQGGFWDLSSGAWDLGGVPASPHHDPGRAVRWPAG